MGREHQGDRLVTRYRSKYGVDAQTQQEEPCRVENKFPRMPEYSADLMLTRVGLSPVWELAAMGRNGSRNHARDIVAPLSSRSRLSTAGSQKAQSGKCQD